MDVEKLFNDLYMAPTKRDVGTLEFDGSRQYAPSISKTHHVVPILPTGQ